MNLPEPSGKSTTHCLKRILSIAILLVATLPLPAQIPAGYYNAASGLTGANLKTALYNIIKNHTVISYNGLWDAFTTTDVNANGKVWDMYSNCTFSFSNDQCGSYSVECDCYNREHSFPSSWFNDGSPMISDLFHIYPTDGKVNGMRSNYPFGTVGTPTYTSGNGSRLGNCNYPGYSSVVFEPIDEYKGDFARSYFYMATRYENLIASWQNNTGADAVLNGTSYPCFDSWFLNLLGAWHVSDPVSQKEIDRNNEIYSNYQHNRNPFIDHPEYVYQIWGVGAQPVTPVITGPATVCAGSSGNVYSTQSGETNYTWIVSSGGTITAGGTSSSNTVTVAWNNSGARTVSVNFTTTGGYTAPSPTVYNVNVIPQPVPTISGAATVTVGTTNSYTTETGMLNYIWTVSPDGSLVPGGANSVNITWPTTGSKTVTVNYCTNPAGCSASSATVLPVVVNQVPEPTNFPTDFSAHNILLQWTDATGSDLPAAYLIRMSSTGFADIVAPTDGTTVPDGPADKNVPFGVQQAWFGNLTPGTTYYFKLFAYSGSGGSINYKTDGTVPQVMLSTAP